MVIKYHFILLASFILLLFFGCTRDDNLTRVEAYEIAQDSNVCTQIGTLSTQSFYNDNSKTWWIDINTYEPYPNCNPACVVSEKNKTVEINWRCTGLLEE